MRGSITLALCENDELEQARADDYREQNRDHKNGSFTHR